MEINFREMNWIYTKQINGKNFMLISEKILKKRKDVSGERENQTANHLDLELLVRVTESISQTEYQV